MLAPITMQTEIFILREGYKSQSFEEEKDFRERMAVFQVCAFIECDKAEQ
jgi:hypothetical protein